MVMQNLYPLSVFLLVARHGSVTRAADELSISQPAASAHIKLVERQLGAELFERTPRGVRLTPCGEVVAEHARRLLATLEDMHAAARSIGVPRGQVRLAASSTPAAYFLPPLLRQFGEAYPEVEVQLSVGHSREVLRQVGERESVLGLVGELPSRDAARGVVRELAGTDCLRLCSAPSNPLTRRSKIRRRDLRGQTVILREVGSSTRSHADRILGGLVEAFDRVLVLASSEAIKEAVLAGMGVAVLSTWATRREESAGLLRPVPDASLSAARPFYVVRLADRSLSGGATALWNFLRSTGE